MTAGWLGELALAGGSPLLQLVQAMTDAGPAVYWQAPMAALLAVLVALLVDWLWGEPPVRLHPVVYMGQLLSLLGQAIAPLQALERAYGRFVLAALAWCLLAGVAWWVYAALMYLLQAAPWWLNGLVAGLLLKPLLSWRMLRSEVLAVEAALGESLDAGRARLSWLVSRDTAQLDAATVRESAIETLAENLSDSVLAPLFWFAVAGLPGAALYRLANTADAMWGYPGWRGQ
ncbi:cobalamin biosynthesis protein, partial [Comamonas sp. B-9]|uniref:CobD/CbiB family cobalamin biosynthesis protein n=1 Tax=Comamonas sp. B-9 TaxID=1055192 RepID=UPI000395A02E